MLLRLFCLPLWQLAGITSLISDLEYERRLQACSSKKARYATKVGRPLFTDHTHNSTHTRFRYRFCFGFVLVE